MLNKLRQVSIIHQISAMLFIATLLVLAFFTAFVAWSSNNTLLSQAEESLDKEVKLVEGMLRFYDQTLKQNTANLGDLFFSLYPNNLSIDTRNSVAIGKYDAPLLWHSGDIINLNFETVDHFTEMTSGVATVFAKQVSFTKILFSFKKALIAWVAFT